MPDPERPMPEPSVNTGPLILWMLLLVVAGMPMIYVLWGSLNKILLGQIGTVEWGLTLPVLAIFLGFLYFLSRLVRRWEGWSGASNGEPHR